MGKRILSSVVLVLLAAVLVAAQFYVPAVFTAAVALLCMTGVYEMAHAVSLSRNCYYLCLSVAAAAGIVFLQSTRWIGLLLFIYTAAMFLGQLRFHDRVSVKDMLTLYAVTLFISFALGSGAILRDTDEKTGIIMVLLGVLTAWISDVGGYFGGRFFGKKKLCPKISPKKTVAGVIGGFVLNLAVMLLIGLLLQALLKLSVNWQALVLLALCGTPFSILGDLSFSLIKREYGIKDYGKLIPGHGGILDRFDGVTFTLPMAMLLFSFLPLA